MLTMGGASSARLAPPLKADANAASAIKRSRLALRPKAAHILMSTTVPAGLTFASVSSRVALAMHCGA